MAKEKNKPVIGITACLLEQVPGQSHGRPAMHLGAQYCKAVLDAGGMPLLIPTASGCAAGPHEVVGAIDGLLLSGGRHVSGSSFKRNPGLTLRETDPDRWDYETALVRGAHGLGLPVLGICRGLQTICEAWPGGRVDNLAAMGGKDPGHYQTAAPAETSHGITTVRGSRLHRLIGSKARVNSFHRQVAGALPEGFAASAHADDGFIEAIEYKEGFVLGVQFHPEWLYQDKPYFLKIFQALIEHSLGRAGK